MYKKRLGFDGIDLVKKFSVVFVIVVIITNHNEVHQAFPVTIISYFTKFDNRDFIYN